MELDNSPAKTITMAEYASKLAADGATVIPGSSGTYWVEFELGTLVRRPVFNLASPSFKEVHQVLRQVHSPIATYVKPATGGLEPNGWLYVCEDKDYGIEKLDKNGRRDARRALREFHYEFVDTRTFLRKGIISYCDSRARVGLSDGTSSDFNKNFEKFLKNPAHKILGAWRNGFLAGFMSLVIVDNWVEIGAYSADQYLKFCPNNGLIHVALDYFLVRHDFRLVSYGLSSIQETSSVEGLHFFKKKVGFVARPVHRTFVLHPILKPLVNRATLWTLRTLTHVRPQNRKLKKATGLMATILGKDHNAGNPRAKGQE